MVKPTNSLPGRALEGVALIGGSLLEPPAQSGVMGRGVTAIRTKSEPSSLAKSWLRLWRRPSRITVYRLLSPTLTNCAAQPCYSIKNGENGAQASNGAGSETGQTAPEWSRLNELPVEDTTYRDKPACHHSQHALA